MLSPHPGRVFLAGFCDGASLLVASIHLAGLIRVAVR
jgi:hypothetical protein